MSVALVLAEHDADGIIDPSLRAVTFARSLASEIALCVIGDFPVSGEPVSGKPGSGEPAIAAKAAEYGSSRVFAVRASGYAPLAWARALAGLADMLSAEAIIAAGTDHGNEVMAHVGAITGEEMVANCFAGSRVADTRVAWHLTRQRWGGSLIEEAHLEARRALLTVATDAVQPVPAQVPAQAEVSAFEPQLAEGDTAVVAVESRQMAGGVSLANARVVVSGGRGVGGPEGFSVIEEIAAHLGGAVGVSRVVTSLGWRPHKEQVGQTGTRVTPDLYIACGISGAIQHLAGCQSAKTMIAINTDPDAPIMARADYAVIGDVSEVLPALLEALRARR
ncbi:MAG: electron transfer flavoprotein subunit alpha/FixB family protein [Acidimicrobiales bacterium]